MKAAPHPTGVYGVMAEFDRPEDVLEATRRAYEHGYRMIEAYSPFPVEGLTEAMGYHRNRVAPIVLIGGVLGGLGGFFMQWYSAVLSYPIDVGGRPFNSWPAFIPITFEMTVLFASLAAVFGMLAMNGLPRPHHPVFHVAGFERASRDRFFLCIQARDPLFDLPAVRQFLAEQRPRNIAEVPF
jgi:hypothetical protein